MPFAAEAIYVLLEGSAVLPITGVTEQYVPTDVLIYDGETYRDTIDAGFIGTARSLIVHETGGVSPVDVVISNGSTTNVIGSSGTTLSYAAVNDPFIEESDEFTHTPPHPLEKTRTLWTFTRGSGFSCVVWADLVQGISDKAPYRLGMTPTAVA